MRAFVDEYSAARTTPLNRSERQQIGACATFLAAQTARCEHCGYHRYDANNDPDSFITALREHGLNYLPRLAPAAAASYAVFCFFGRRLVDRGSRLGSLYDYSDSSKETKKRIYSEFLGGLHVCAFAGGFAARGGAGHGVGVG